MGNYWGFFSIEKIWSDLHFRKITLDDWTLWDYLSDILLVLPKLKLFTPSSEKMEILFLYHLFNLPHKYNNCSPLWNNLFQDQKFQFRIFKINFFEVNPDLHVVVRDNTERSPLPFIQFSLMVTSWITMVHYYNWKLVLIQSTDLIQILLDLHAFTWVCIYVCGYRSV